MGFLSHWLMLFGFWLILSGQFDVFHLAVGVIGAAGVALLSHQLQWFDVGDGEGVSHHLAATPWVRQGFYAVWLLREIVIANWQVMRIVLHPRLPIDPTLVHFQSQLTSDLGVTILANSITLTPGTITVHAGENRGEFVIHALVAGDSVGTAVSAMQKRIIATLPTIETAAGSIV